MGICESLPPVGFVTMTLSSLPALGFGGPLMPLSPEPSSCDELFPALAISLSCDVSPASNSSVPVTARLDARVLRLVTGTSLSTSSSSPSSPSSSSSPLHPAPSTPFPPPPSLPSVSSHAVLNNTMLSAYRHSSDPKHSISNMIKVFKTGLSTDEGVNAVNINTALNLIKVGSKRFASLIKIATIINNLPLVASLLFADLPPKLLLPLLSPPPVHN